LAKDIEEELRRQLEEEKLKQLERIKELEEIARLKEEEVNLKVSLLIF
jgi:hypothetical protein